MPGTGNPARGRLQPVDAAPRGRQPDAPARIAADPGRGSPAAHGHGLTSARAARGPARMTCRPRRDLCRDPRPSSWPPRPRRPAGAGPPRSRRRRQAVPMLVRSARARESRHVDPVLHGDRQAMQRARHPAGQERLVSAGQRQPGPARLRTPRSRSSGHPAGAARRGAPTPPRWPTPGRNERGSVAQLSFPRLHRHDSHHRCHEPIRNQLPPRMRIGGLGEIRTIKGSSPACFRTGSR